MGNARKHRWVRAVENALFARQLKGTLGKLESDGAYTFDVPNTPGFVYVTGETGTIHEALFAGVGRQAGRPVVMTRTASGDWRIDGSDPDKVVAYQGAAATAITDVAMHTHQIGTGYEYPIEARRIEPGMIYPTTGTAVYIVAFWYLWNGALVFWPGGDIDLTSNRPATSGYYAYVMVGIDPTTNTAVAVTGAERASKNLLTAYDLGNINFLHYIGRGGIILQEGQTATPTESDILDCRPFASATPFVPYMHSQTLTGNITIPASHNAILIAPVTVTGSLTVNGSLRVL